MSLRDASDLSKTLRQIDGRGYKAYKQLTGAYGFDTWTLFIDHVQGDPFAAPSKMRLRLAQSVAEIPPHLFDNRVRRLALEDFLGRAVSMVIPRGTRRGTGKSGLITIDAGAQEVLERTAVVVTPEWVEARIELGLPAAGRTISGRHAEELLLSELPKIVDASLRWQNLDKSLAIAFVDTVENYEHLRTALAERKLVAFVADGAVLPRESGASDCPMRDAVPFRAPRALRVSLPLLHARDDGATEIEGMGVAEGVTLIVGGGYHGKSTVLKAIERGVYPHIPGDGREYVVCRNDAVKIRSEDGRRVANVDISPFIQHLPLGRSTSSFSSEDASGSTSQAANIMEALEVGAHVLLLDEDTSATNFLVRDARMQALVTKEHEPILPFLDRVRELYLRLGVSTILVMGGSGDYFEPADTVIRMMDYLPEDATEQAKDIAARQPTGRTFESESPLKLGHSRRFVPASVDASRGRRDLRIEARGRAQLVFGEETIDVRALEQLVDVSQTRAVGYAMVLAAKRLRFDASRLSDILDALDALLDEEGLDALAPFERAFEHPGNFARPRRFEIAASFNRLRMIEMETI